MGRGVAKLSRTNPRPAVPHWPPSVTARVAIEQASSFGWARWVGPSGRIVAMSTFGSSAPLKDLQSKFGFTPEAITAAARALVGERAGKQG